MKEENEANQWTEDQEGCYHLKVGNKEAILIPTTLEQWQAVIYAGPEKIEREYPCDLPTAKRWAVRQLTPSSKPGMDKPTQIVNRKLSIPGVFLSDVAHALEEKQIPLTKENIESAATHVESIASAYAKATLQDASREDWLDWIETFKGKS